MDAQGRVLGSVVCSRNTRSLVSPHGEARGPKVDKVAPLRVKHDISRLAHVRICSSYKCEPLLDAPFISPWTHRAIRE